MHILAILIFLMHNPNLFNEGSSFLQNEIPSIVLNNQGTFEFFYHQTEFGDRMEDFPVRVIIENRRIIVIQEKQYVSGGDTIVDSKLWLHQSGVVVIHDLEESKNADEVGGCTEYRVIDFKNRIVIGC